MQAGCSAHSWRTCLGTNQVASPACCRGQSWGSCARTAAPDSCVPSGCGAGSARDAAGVWTRRALGCKRCWWFATTQQGLLPKAAERLGNWQQDLQHWGGFVLSFLVAFLKRVSFAILPVLRQNFSWQSLSEISGNSVSERRWG